MKAIAAALVANLLRVAYGVAPVGRTPLVRRRTASASTLSTADRVRAMWVTSAETASGPVLPISSRDGRLMAQAEAGANENGTLAICIRAGLIPHALQFTVSAGKATKVRCCKGERDD